MLTRRIGAFEHDPAGREGLDREAVHIRFYSDHVSDAPVHHWSDEAVAANAHDRLVRLAEAEGWEIHDWRREI